MAAVFVLASCSGAQTYTVSSNINKVSSNTGEAISTSSSTGKDSADIKDSSSTENKRSTTSSELPSTYVAPRKNDEKETTLVTDQQTVKKAKQPQQKSGKQAVDITQQQEQQIINEQEEKANKVPPLPEAMPPIMAPKQVGHPLANSTKIIFMLGEDAQGYYLYGEGMIAEGTYDKFLRYVDYYNKKGIELDRVMIHSPGGLMNEAIQIGTYMQENHWGAASDQYMKCYSACGIIFASGVYKQIQQGAEIGFHRPYDPNKVDTEEFKRHMYQVYQPYWKYIGGSSELYDDFMKNYGRDQMLILTESNIDQFMKVERI